MHDKPRFAISRIGGVSLQAITYILLLSLPASAGDTLHHLLGCPVPDCIGKWCRDDYCPKKEPCASVSMYFRCDDYCGKKAPCVCAPLRFGCDDYRQKCPPKPCNGSRSQFLKCGESCRQCDCEKCEKLSCDACDAKSVGIRKETIADGEDHVIDDPLPARRQQFPPVIVRSLDLKLTK